MITQRHRIMQMLQLAISLRIATQFPNTQTAVIPVPIGTKMDIEPPGELYGYKFVKAEGLGKIVGDDGLNIICYYEDPSGKLPVEYKVEYDWGTDLSEQTRHCLQIIQIRQYRKQKNR